MQDCKMAWHDGTVGLKTKDEEAKVCLYLTGGCADGRTNWCTKIVEESMKDARLSIS